MTTFIDNPGSVTFKVNQETRTLRGLALPFDVAARDSMGQGPWLFDADTAITWDRAKLLDGHDWRALIGTSGFSLTDEGVEFVAKVARTGRGDEVLALAQPDDDSDQGAALDGVSLGFANDGFEFEKRGDIYHVTAAHITELSVTPTPAFTGAQIRSVAASAAPKEGTPNMETTSTTAAPEVEFSAQLDALNQKVDALADIKVPVPAGAQFTVREEPVYRFAGTQRAASGHDFAEDVFAAAVRGDGAALERIQTFAAERLIGPAFVTTGNVDELNQPVHRPDMFMGQAPTPASPMYDFHHRGGLTDVTPFFYSKLDRANTTVAVANHVEGTDPTATTLVTATGATVTPSAVSGKVHITREVSDQGGSPQVSALIWNEFERSWKIALETKTHALYTASAGAIASLTTAIPAGANGQVAGLALKKGLLKLQFLADGSRFVKGFAHEDLYTELATFENADGEPLYPIINPQNRDGISGDKYSFIDVAGYRFSPTATLGATATSASNSYVSDPNAVHVWNSGLQRLEKLGEKVEGWDIGCFGYFAGIVYDGTGIRKVAYDPTA